MQLADNSRYRQDIQQLRGIAVIAVILNHLDFVGTSRGFLGVDVFFVVSGFVITSSMLGAASVNASRWSFLGRFWLRRVFRLWPMLFATVAVTSILIVLGGLSSPGSLMTGASSLVGISNIRLLLGRLDYFGLNTANDWFMHTWSLAVEEQIYLTISVIFSLFHSRSSSNVATRRRQLLLVVGFLCTASLITSLAFQSNELVRFYSPHTRFYQVGLGVLLALISPSPQRLAGRLGERFHSVTNVAALGVLLFQFTYGPNSPPVASLTITLTTAALLCTTTQNQRNSGLLPIPWLNEIGNRSYSLYLVHWPVQLLWSTFTTHRLLLTMGSLLTTMLFGSLGYRWVEHSTRHLWVQISVRRAVLLPAAGLIASMGITLTSFSVLEIEARSSSEEAARSICDDNDAIVWVIGDSHLYSTPVQSIISDHVDGKCGSLGGYGLVLNFDDLGWNADGGRQLQAQLPTTDFLENEILLRDPPPQVVIITHFLTGYLSDQSTSPASASLNFVVTEWRGPDGNLVSRKQFLQLLSLNLAKIAEILDRFGGSLIVTSPPPDFDWFSGSFGNNFCRNRLIVSRECSILGTEATISLEQHEARGADIRKLLDGLAQTHSNFLHLRLDTPFCGSEGCSNFSGGKAVYMDDDHINEAGGKLVMPLLDGALDRVLPSGPREISCPPRESVYACRVTVRGGLTDRYSKIATFVANSESSVIFQMTHKDNESNSYCLSLTDSDQILFRAGICSR